MRNVLFWVGVKSDNPDLIKLKEYGDWSWMDYSKRTWEFWCKKHDVEFVHYDKTSDPDVLNHLVNWQRWFDVFDILESRGIEYNQIMLVDASSMVHWNAPNFFHITDHKWCAFRANENMKWTMESTDGYQDMFPDVKFAYNDYIASGLAIFNKTHKPMLKALNEFYNENYDALMQKQKTVKRGTDQPVINYMLRKFGHDINILRLPYACNHLYRREMLVNNWQLNEDPMPFFLKYLHIWFYSGLPNRGSARAELMKQTWSIIGHMYSDEFVLNNVRHKNQYVKTTSYKFKQDLIQCLGQVNRKSQTVLELGCCRGDTTRVLAEIFGKVYAVDIMPENIKEAKALYDMPNIEWQEADVYNGYSFPQEADVIIIDASHEMFHVLDDIKSMHKRYPNAILILDDYSNGGDIRNAVHKALEDDSSLSISRYIGENAGYEVTRMNGERIKFTGPEGVIINLK